MFGKLRKDLVAFGSLGNGGGRVKSLSVIILIILLTVPVSAKTPSECREACYNRSLSCIVFGRGARSFTLPLHLIYQSAQSSSEGIVGEICGRQTIKMGDRLQNNGRECEWNDGISQSILTDQIRATIDLNEGKKVLFFESVHTIIFRVGRLANVKFITELSAGRKGRYIVWGTDDEDEMCFAEPADTP